MDEYTASIFVNDDITTASTADTDETDDTVNPSDHEDNTTSDVEPQTPPARGLRSRVAALRDKAGVQDRLLEKSVVCSVYPNQWCCVEEVQLTWL